ncbi:protein of unknown function [Lentzea albidocapillata subsp. violacea]|uniref:DUF1996 domain-containing protein n=1 Tax=Lentzea albidocapillata subsp. violacea TaxID=128104 RepID=A0A1G9TI62_9PSEU|nr:DUF1996 domain-containing protein [Lentzea albidocapillata]SDM47343.1 protein of unknown function [Lentzea albidocapillata subsp. violacea]
MAIHRRKSTIWLTAAAAAMAVVAGGAAVVAVSSSDGSALADGADKSLFVDITKVKPNVKKPRAENDATTGTFTVDCGRNENGHFNPDNFIAQPGVRNGAEHLHDYVGNLSTNADSNNKSLQAAGTTCKNGDKSAYFWPVVRIIDEEPDEAAPPAEQAPPKKDDKAQQDKDKAAKEAAQLECPDVASLLPEDVPDAAQPEIDRELENVEKVTAEAEKRLEQVKAQDRDNIIVGPTREKRAAILNRMMLAFSRQGKQAPDLNPAAACAVKDQAQGEKGLDNGGENSDDAQAEGTENKKNENNPEENANNELEGNEGEIQRPAVVDLTFRGSPTGKVTAMPKFLRVLYGDAKAGQNGPKNAKASWTCTGFEDKVLIDKYPICPQGSKVKRVHDFPSCWDGKNIDSANHRDHIVFPDQNGKCKRGFKAVPQLRISLTYNIPLDVQQDGRYLVDSFPEEEHNPLTDHDDFANVMSQKIMNRLVKCINTGKKCRE